MRSNLTKFAQAAGIMLAMALTFSCSGDDGDEGGGGGTVESIKKEKIGGVSQKGPFAKGSAITLSELNDKLAPTGRSFEEIITDEKGSFEIKNVEIVSPYVILKANGFYRNEVTGKISNAPINLYAIADIMEKNNVNVNLLTHLEYYRVQKLVEDGKSLENAKKQAQMEILAAFGISGEFKNSEDMSIFGTTDADAALLAISILLQGELSEGQFTERLTDLRIGFRENGVWNNETEKNLIAEWAESVDMGLRGSLKNIRDSILNWNLSTEIPNFEKFVRNYLYFSYGLGDCNAELQGRIKSNRKGVNYICQSNVWLRELSIITDQTDWGIITDQTDDAAVKGTTTINNAKDESGNYIVFMKDDDGNWVAKINNYILGGKLTSTNNDIYDPHTEIDLYNIYPTYQNLRTCEHGISYRYKGTSHKFMAGLEPVKDYNYHYAIIPASEVWKRTEVSYDNLEQENWGKPEIPFDKAVIERLRWEIRGGVSAPTGSLAIKDIQCY